MLPVILGAVLIIGVLWDAFEAIVFPRRVTRRIRLTRLFYRYTWLIWSTIVRRLVPRRRQENLLSLFGPLSLILLLAVWAAGLILGFALLQFGTGSAVRARGLNPGFAIDVYLSGTNFFTLGLGDVVPLTVTARVLTVLEAGIGFGFLALIISYLPALNQSFSRREVNISMLDARAGSPPTALEVLRRHAEPGAAEELKDYLFEWERWSAELMESHLSYPVLAYFRSQHDNQSWLGALTVILDTSAILALTARGSCARQAQRTFAMARHVCVDLAIVFGCPAYKTLPERLPAEAVQFLGSALQSLRFDVENITEVDQRLKELRHMYEPYVYSLADYLCLTLPSWFLAAKGADNWERSACEVFPYHQLNVKGDHF